VLKRNLVANFVGTFWSAVLSIALIPFYIRYLGVEAYGIVAFSITLQSLLSPLDLGLGTTLNREMARLSAGGDTRRARRLAVTLQAIYWSIAVAIAASVYLAAPFLARGWFHATALTAASLEHVLRLMALIIGVQFPFTLYSGGLLGLQRHVDSNAALVIGASLRGIGSVAALAFIAPTLTVFCAWQLLGYAVQTGLVALLFFRALPSAHPDAEEATQPPAPLWRFAAGVTGITVFAAVLTQMDKVVLSKVLPLREFGYYAIAASIASALALIAVPFFATMFPRLSQIAARHDDAALAGVYRRSSQLLGAVVLAPAVILMLFSRQVITVWTGDAALAGNTHAIVTLLAAGFALNAINSLPYALQLAHGWTTPALVVNAASVVILVPLVWWAARTYGVVGAAVGWMLLNAGYVGVLVQIMHRRILPAEKPAWYAGSVLRPLAASCLVAVPARFLVAGVESRGAMFAALAVVSIVTLTAAVWFTPYPRQLLRELVGRI
jgi:O-antigen/teichoic acid export membrane protein